MKQSRHSIVWRGSRIIRAISIPVAAFLAVSFSGVAAAAPTAPPPVSILTSSGNLGNGDIFITPTGGTNSYANGPEILDQHGNVVWFHAIPQAQTASDFRVQTYRGKHVLTWWQGTGLGGLASGTDYIYNEQRIASVQARQRPRAPPGRVPDHGAEPGADPLLHDRDGEPDLDRGAAEPRARVVDGVVAYVDSASIRIDVPGRTGPTSPTARGSSFGRASSLEESRWIRCINAVHVDGGDDLLIDARDTWTTYEVNRHSGEIVWKLGGKDSSFSLALPPGQTLDAGQYGTEPTTPSCSGTTSTRSSTTSRPASRSCRTAGWSQ